MARMQAAVLAESLARPALAVVATTRKQGPPYLAPVWFLWEPNGRVAAQYPFYPEGTFWLIGTYMRQWCKHLLVRPQVSLCITGEGIPGYIAVDCSVEPVEPRDHDIWPVATRLTEKYVGARSGPEAAARFLANMRTEPRLLFRLTPETWRAIDLTVYTGNRGDIAYQQAHATSEPT
jgi:hypothetical protein